MSTTPRVRRWRRVITTISLTAVALVAGAGVAAAHVTVNPGEVAAGDFTKLTFRVPNESPTAGTTAVTFTIPTDHPFAFVSVKSVPGWTVTPTRTTLPTPVTEGDTTIKEAVTSITWTADAGTQIGPNEFGEFDISVGPVPAVESIAFEATQTYSDGSVVEWNEPTPASGEEPEHPAPTLTVGAAAADGDGDHAHSDGAAASAAAAPSSSIETSVEPVNTAASTTETSSAPTIIAVISLVVAAGALLVAAIALRRKPGGPANPPAAG